MKKCKNCGKEFPFWINIDGIRHNMGGRTHCLECVPFGSHAMYIRKDLKDFGACKNCGKPLKARNRTFCDLGCFHDYQYKEFISKWKNNEIDGAIGDAWLDTSKHIRRYLFEKYDNKCSRCGWSERNPYTNRIPLEIEHIDGNAENNKEENLTLLCPNCHSLTKTYRGANKGFGTRKIQWVSRGGTTNVLP